MPAQNHPIVLLHSAVGVSTDDCPAVRVDLLLECAGVRAHAQLYVEPPYTTSVVVRWSRVTRPMGGPTT